MVVITEIEETPKEVRGDDATELTTLLQSLSSSSPPPLTDQHLHLVARVLSPLSSLRRNPASDRCRALAFLVLSRMVTDPKTTLRVATLISAYILAQLQETSIPRLFKGISLLDALLQVDAPAKGGDGNGGVVTKRVLEADGVVESLIDGLDVQLFTTEEDEESTTDVKENELPDINQQHALLDCSLAQLFSSMANIPAYRAILDGRPRSWLEQHLAKPSTTNQSSANTQAAEAQTRVVAAVALTKLAKATIVDPTLKGKTESAGEGENEQEEIVTRAGDDLDRLTSMLKGIVIGGSSDRKSTDATPSADSGEAITSALEGLAYTSSQPTLKEALGNDEQFLRSLVDIAKSLSQSQRTSSTKLSASYGTDFSSDRSGQGNQAAAYGISTIMYNLFARKVVLSEEQRQMEALKKMANAGATGGKNKTMGQAAKESSNAEDESMLEEAVHARVQRGIKNGAVEAISALVKVDSLRVKQVLGGVLLALVHEREDRLEIVKQGGYKALKTLVASLLESASPAAGSIVDKESLPALQALAKLVITTPPPQLFGTDSRSGAMDTVRPMALLLLHPDNSMLQRFEAMMALTNLASVDPLVAQRIYTFQVNKPTGKPVSDQGRTHTNQANDQIVQAVENQMLDDHKLVRRAAVELVCNLLISDESFARYSGDYIAGSNPSITSAEQARKASTPRLHILLALTDVRDLPTRLAASGALAMLTQSETASGILLGLGGDSKKVWEKVAGLLAPLRADQSASGDEDFDEEEDDIEEVSTLPPDEGLVYRGLTIILNLFSKIEKLSPTDKEAKFREADTSGLTRHLLNLLAMWTDKSLLMAKKVKSPPKEVLDLGIECLRILKSNGVQLVV